MPKDNSHLRNNTAITLESVLVNDLVQKGCHKAFTELHLKYRERISSLVAKYIFNPADREELCADIWLKVYAKAHLFQQRSLFLTWIWRVALNTTYNYLSYMSRKPLYLQMDLHKFDNHSEDGSKQDPLDLLRIDTVSPEDIVEADYKEWLFHETLSNLSSDLQESFEYHLGDMPNREIAELQGIPEVSLRGRVLRVRLAYKNALELLEKEAEMPLIDFCESLLELEDSRREDGSIGRGYSYFKGLPEDYLEVYLLKRDGASIEAISEWVGFSQDKVNDILIEIRDNLKSLIKLNV